MIVDAKHSIYLSSWIIDIDFKIDGKSINELIYEKLESNVVVYILYFNNIFYNYKNKIEPHKNLKIRYLDTYGYTMNPICFISGIKNKNNKINCNHSKYLLVDNKYMLLNGTDINSVRQGNIITGTTNYENYIWYETCLKLELDLNINNVDNHINIINFAQLNYDMNSYYNAIYTNNTNKYKLLINGSSDSDDKNVESSINLDYENLKDIINSASNYIYIENQYFFSFCMTNNKINKLLIDKIKENPSIKIIIVTNDFYNDTSNFFIILTLIGYTFVTQYELFNYKNNIKFYYLKHENGKPIFIHSKYILCDDKVVSFSTMNICDRSLFKNIHDNEITLTLYDSNSINKTKEYFESIYDIPFDKMITNNQIPKKYVEFNIINNSIISTIKYYYYIFLYILIIKLLLGIPY